MPQHAKAHGLGAAADAADGAAVLRILEKSFEHASQAQAVLNKDRCLVRVNRAFLKLLQYEKAADVLGRRVDVVLAAPPDAEAEREQLSRLPWGHEPVYVDARVCTHQGHERWLRITSSPVAGESADEVDDYTLDVFYDITEERHLRDLEREVLRSLTSHLSFTDLGRFLCRRLREIVPDVLPSILLLDAHQHLRVWATNGLPEAFVQAVEGFPAGEGQGSCGTAAMRGIPVISADIRTDPLWSIHGPAALVHGLRACWSYPIKRLDGSVLGVFALYARQPSQPTAFHENLIEVGTRLAFFAIEREEYRVATERLSQFDRLTGLPNRDRARAYIDELLSEGQKPLAVLTIGLDGFRLINEGLGHAAGDRVLLMIADRLRTQLQPGDMLSHHEGDLFVIVAPQCDAAAALARIDEVQAAITQPITIDERHLVLSACIGIALHPGSGAPAALRANSKKAMYEAKAAGPASARFFDPEMNRRAHDRLLMGNALRNALAEGLLRLNYQPQVHSSDGCLRGVEALARWNDPQFGAVSPEIFIPLAEEIGLIKKLGRWALREACRQLAQWRAEQVQVPIVSVNLSARSFQDDTLPTYIAGLLTEYGLSGDSLTVEITENTMMVLTPRMRAALQDLRNLGVGLSMDDFGTGYSSLSGLAGLPVTEVKIDRDFIQRSASDPRIAALVSAMISIGQSLGLCIVAEGVETDIQHRLLLRQDPAVIIQGYLFSKPLAPQDIPAWWAAASARVAHARKNSVLESRSFGA